MRTSHSWLMDEHFIMLHPALCWALDSMSLAATVQALEYKLNYAKNSSGAFGKFENGRWWVYISKSSWHKALYFLSESTVNRSVKKLEDLGVFLSHGEVTNAVNGGARKWFTIDYDKLNEIGESKGPRPYEPPQMDEDEGEYEGGVKMTQPPAKGGVKMTQPGGQNDTTSKNTSNNPDEEVLSTSGEVASAAPSAGDAPAHLEDVKKRRSSRNTKTGEKDIEDDAVVEPDTELAKAICAVTGSKRLTALMDRQIKQEYEIVTLGKDPTTFKACPVDLYENDPLFKIYFDKLVEKMFEVMKGDKRLSRQKLINAITTGDNQGKAATRKHLSDYFRWKEKREAQTRSEAAAQSLSSREAVEAPGFVQTTVDDELAQILARIKNRAKEGANNNG